jgi:8-oxo-dGTP pyrophosphatase MutT (NUDIX family)
MPHNITIGVLGLPINKNGEYLLALRNDPNNSKTHNKWELIGGGLEFGESFEDCLHREVREEIGVKPNLLFPYPIIFTKKRTTKHRSQLILATYLVSIGDQLPNPNHHEILEVKWFFPQLLHQLESLDLTTEFIAEAEKIRMHYALDTVLQYNHR